MKRIVLALALIASMQVAGAQVKSASSAKKAVEAAEAVAANPKKATKADTWIKLGKAYMDAYNAPAGNGIIGLDRKSIALTMSGLKPSSTQSVTLAGETFTKEVYPTCDYYYNANDQLAMVVVTKPVIKDALPKALDAYKKAYAADTKKAKTKDIHDGIKSVYEKYVNDAYNDYTFEQFAGASSNFEAAALASQEQPYAKVDTSMFYNAGFTAMMAGDNSRAESLFKECLKYNYYGADGDVFVRLASIAEAAGDKAAQKQYLEDGFSAYPQSQGILIGLINYYLTNKEDTNRLFTLIGKAKENEPGNASLSYVEGNIYKELGQTDEAIAAYRKCAEINPNYEYGYIGEGILFYNQAIEYQEAASEELDDAKYMKLVDSFVASLKACIEPFEKAYEITKDESLKSSLCEYLKNACYRFRDDDPSYMAKYEKYNAGVGK